MRNLKFLAMILAMIVTQSLRAQFWNTNGNNINGPEWLGAVPGSTIPLRIQTRDRLPIDWSTQWIHRMRLTHNIITHMGPVDQHQNVQRDGFLLLSGQPDAFTNLTSRAPFTRIHLIDQDGSGVNPTVYAQQDGYRPWQRNGITLTGNSDQSYIGHKYNENDITDLVIQWSDNPNASNWGTDRLKFVFTTRYNQATPKGAATMEGMEAMRFWPRNNTEVNVGVGDFAPIAVGDPTERLDVLDGRVRFRQLPDDPEAPELTKVLVVDDTPSPSGERGVIKWRNIPIGGSGGNPCSSGWTMIGNSPVTAYDGNPCPPQDQHFVGIGTNAPQAKLHVDRYLTNGQTTPNGMLVNMTTATTFNTGTSSSSVGVGGGENRGVEGRAHGANRNFGVRGISSAVGNGSHTGVYGVGAGSSFNGNATGVFGEASGGSQVYGLRGGANPSFGASPLEVCGVKALAIGNSATGATYGVHSSGSSGNPSTTWAGYFQGRLNVTGDCWNTTGSWNPSDLQFKTNVEDIDNAGEILEALNPKTYDFIPQSHPDLQFPSGQHLGLIAQELEEIIPALVRSTVAPAVFDTLGNQIHESVAHKGVNYIGLIPLLIAGHKEQQAQITEQQATNDALTVQLTELISRMEQLEQLLALCCQDPDQRNMINEGSVITDPFQDRNLHIQPNPFNEQTTVYYMLERTGRMQLLANSSDGKQLRVLQEAHMEAGQYQFEWFTADLAPGIYYVTLLLDGQPIVKKAVKVN